MYHHLIIVFLFYSLNNLYQLNARKLELRITDPSGQLYTNRSYHYTNESKVVLTCSLLNNQTKFEMFWTSGNIDQVITRVSPKSNSWDNYEVALGGREPTVQCHVRELPFGDGTTNLTSSVRFVRDTQTTAMPAPNAVENVSGGESGKSEDQSVLWYAAGAAAVFALALALLITRYVCKRSSDKKLLEFELDRGETEAAEYASPRDDLRGDPPPLCEYVEPYRETDINLMYSTPIPKSDRTSLKKKMERDNDGSYEYVRHAQHAASNGKAHYVNGL